MTTIKRNKYGMMLEIRDTDYGVILKASEFREGGRNPSLEVRLEDDEVETMRDVLERISDDNE